MSDKQRVSSGSFSLDLRTFLNSLPMPVCLFNYDVENRYSYEMANAAYVDYFSREVEGFFLDELLSDEELKDLQQHYDVLTQVKVSQKALIFRKYPFKNDRNKTMNWVDTFFFPLVLEGKTRAIINLVVDVTEAYNYEQGLKRERDLRDDFLSHLTHDLNQPIYIAKSSLETLAKELHSEDFKKLASHGLTGIRRTESMIKNLLDAYYMDTRGVSNLNFAEFEPCELAKTLIDVHSFTYGDRFFLLEENIKVFWDREAFTRMLDNLLSNAVKYSPAGTPITIAFWTTESTIVMAIHNVGTYIPPEERENIFRMYERGRTSRKQEGWGLGLHIVKKLAESHGGRVAVESSEETGTVFEVELPKVISSSGN